jgi:hypothetical protein
LAREKPLATFKTTARKRTLDAVNLAHANAPFEPPAEWATELDLGPHIGAAHGQFIARQLAAQRCELERNHLNVVPIELLWFKLRLYMRFWAPARY